jgi:ribosomal-protein-alanine N-acetyltransferase
LTDLSIRRASAEDLETLYRIEKECFLSEAFTKEQIEYFLRAPNFLNLIAELNGRPVGFVTGALEKYKGKVVGHIYSVDVLEKYRRRGVASRLIEELEKAFAQEGVRICYLEAKVDNIAARSLYKKLGYKTVEVLLNYYGSGAHGVRLRKRLRSITG